MVLDISLAQVLETFQLVAWELLALYFLWLNLSPVEVYFESVLAYCMGIPKWTGISPRPDNTFLFYTALNTTLVLLYSCTSQDDFKAGQQSFDPTMEKPPRLILLSKNPCWSQRPGMVTWQHNSVFMGIVRLFLFWRRKMYTSRSDIISSNAIKTSQKRDYLPAVGYNAFSNTEISSLHFFN